MVILGVILWVGLVILMTEMILGGNFHEKRCCDVKKVLGVILRVVLVILVTERPRERYKE